MSDLEEIRYARGETRQQLAALDLVGFLEDSRLEQRAETLTSIFSGSTT